MAGIGAEWTILPCRSRAVIARALQGGGILMVKENDINFTSSPNTECLIVFAPYRFKVHISFDSWAKPKDQWFNYAQHWNLRLREAQTANSAWIINKPKYMLSRYLAKTPCFSFCAKIALWPTRYNWRFLAKNGAWQFERNRGKVCGKIAAGPRGNRQGNAGFRNRASIPFGIWRKVSKRKTSARFSECPGPYIDWRGFFAGRKSGDACKPNRQPGAITECENQLQAGRPKAVFFVSVWRAGNRILLSFIWGGWPLKTESVRAANEEVSKKGDVMKTINLKKLRPSAKGGHSAFGGKKLIVFDLDGTLAPTKAQMDSEMAGLIKRLLMRYKVALIGGGKLHIVSAPIFKPFKVPRLF